MTRGTVSFACPKFANYVKPYIRCALHPGIPLMVVVVAATSVPETFEAPGLSSVDISNVDHGPLSGTFDL